MLTTIAILFLALPQEAGLRWSELARRYDLAGDTDRATLAWARSLQDGDRDEARREIARLTQHLATLRLTLRPPMVADSLQTPGLSAAAGRIATAGADVRIYDEVSGALAAPPIEVPAREVHLDPTGARAVIVHDDGIHASLWRLDPQLRLQELGCSWGSIEWSPDGLYVARGVKEDEGFERAVVWNAESGAIVFNSGPRSDRWLDLALSADGLFAVEHDKVSKDGAESEDEESRTVTVYDLSDGAVVVADVPPSSAPLRFHPKARRLLLHDGAALRAFDLTAGAWHGPKLVGGNFPQLVACEPSGSRWVVSTNDGAVASLEDGAPAGLPLERDDLQDWSRAKYGMEAHALAPDGSLGAISGLNGTVRVWDTRSGRRLGPALPHGRSVTALCFTDAGSLVSASDDGIVRVWDPSALSPIDPPAAEWGQAVHLGEGSARALVLRHQPVLELLEPDGTTRWRCALPVAPGALTISRDGTRLAALGGASGLWTIDLRVASPEPRRVSGLPWTAAVALDANGQLVACADGDAARVWDIESGALVAQHPLTHDWDASLAFDDKGRLWGIGGGRLAPLAIGAANEPEFEPVGGYLSDHNVWTLDAFGEAHVIGYEDGAVAWHGPAGIATGLERIAAQAELGGVFRLFGRVPEWHCSGTRVVALQTEGASLLDPLGARLVARLVAQGEPLWAELLGDRVVIEGDKGLALYDAADGSLLALHAPNTGGRGACPIPGTNRLVRARTQEELRVVDVLANSQVGEPIVLEGPPSSVLMASPAEAFVGTANGAILCVDLARAQTRKVVQGRGQAILHLACSPDRTRLVYVEQPDRVVLWDLAQERALFERNLAPNLDGGTVRLFEEGPDGRRDPVAIQFDPTGRWLLCATHLSYSIGNSVYKHAPVEAQVIDALNGVVMASLEGCDGLVFDARFSADGERLVTWKRYELQSYETRTGKLLARVTVGNLLEEVTFQGKDHRIAVVDGEERVGVFDADTGAASLAPRRPVQIEHSSAWIDPSGERIQIGEYDGPGQWFDLRSGAELQAEFRAHPSAFGEGGLVLLRDGVLGRWSNNVLEPIARRHVRDSDDEWALFQGRRSTTFLDDTRVVSGAHPTSDGVAFDVLDFGPARDEPASGAPAELLAAWCRRLGLEAREDGQIVARRER